MEQWLWQAPSLEVNVERASDDGPAFVGLSNIENEDELIIEGDPEEIIAQLEHAVKKAKEVLHG